MNMDDMKLFAKNEKELVTLIQSMWIYSQDMGMEFWIEKCAMLIMKIGKRYMTEGIEQPKSRKNKNAPGKGNVQILGNIGSGHHQVEMKERVSQENEKTTRNETI